MEIWRYRDKKIVKKRDRDREIEMEMENVIE